MGEIDELNACIGIALSQLEDGPAQQVLFAVQHDLFDLGGEFSVPGYQAIKDSYITRLERILDEFNAELPNLKEFILPAGGLATSTAHLARTVCRRAERRATTLAREEEINPAAIHYLNRLSDLLFVIARVLARFENGTEVLWQPGKNRGE